MTILKKAIGATFVAGLATYGLAYNPISTYHYLADPGAAADDEYFYIITDSDDPAPYNADGVNEADGGHGGYQIKALYGFRSKDMQNWTDFGIIYDARKVNGIGDIWASGIAVNPNDGRMYIVFPDGGGGGIGLIGADGIEGPWSNPVTDGKKLINNWGGGFADCDGIGWCFDPAIFFDDDGQGYFTFGGGSSDSRPVSSKNSKKVNNIFNIYKFNKDMKGFDVNSKTELEIGGPDAMEASYIHKNGDNYYLSYSTTDLRIAYGMSKNPMGPYEYKGIFMGNPSIGGQNINANNNNHHGIAKFKDRWYVVYHDRRISTGYDGLEKIPAEDGMANPSPAYHRSVSVDEFTYAADGSMNSLTFTKEGPEQIEDFCPYEVYPALTSSKQKGIRSRTDWEPGKIGTHILLPLSSKESWIRVSGVNFGEGAKTFTVKAYSVADGNKVEIHSGSASGALAGTCTLANTGSKTSYKETECEVSGLKNRVDELFIVFKGAQDSTMGILEWSFAGANCAVSAPKHTPYGDAAFEVPGIIEAEYFDKGGSKNAYSDSDADENKGDANFRTDEGVDIVLVDENDASKGMAIGHTTSGEWLEYTINVTKAGKYKLFINAASGSESGSSFQFKVDGKLVGSPVEVATGSWQVYEVIEGGEVELTEGVHSLRLMITGNYVNVDKVGIGVSKEDVEKSVSSSSGEVVDPSVKPADGSGDTSSSSSVTPTDGSGDTENPETDAPLSIGQNVRLNAKASAQYEVYDLSGKMVGSVDLAGKTVSQALRAANFGRGVYMLRSVHGNKSFIATTEK